ncbi:MAG TPA: phosphatase PAP2 family protein [Albitalea sp.]|nr:phosphatase PAP2 family protein [Albitalea sp.]
MRVGLPPPAKPQRKADWAVHVALGAAIIIAGAWLFGGVAPEWLNAKAIASLDLKSAKWLHEHAGPTLTAFMVWVSAVHGTAGILVLAAGAGAILWRRHDRDALLRLALAVPGGLLLNVAVKEAVHRARPHYFESPVQTLTSFSFPSGHTAGSVFFYGFLAWWLSRLQPSPALRAAVLASAFALVALVATSRIVLGAHYLSDVLAAAVEGCAWLAICLSAPPPGPWVDPLSRQRASHGRS